MVTLDILLTKLEKDSYASIHSLQISFARSKKGKLYNQNNWKPRDDRIRTQYNYIRPERVLLVLSINTNINVGTRKM